MNSSELQNLNERLVAAASPEELKDVCINFCELISFEYFLFGLCDATSLSSPKISTLNNYPEDWFKEYLDSDMKKNDPVVRYCFENTAPIRWNKLVQMTQYINPIGEKIMLEARGHGLVDGLSIPIKAPSGEIALLSIATADESNIDDRMANALMLALSYSGALFENYMRLHCEGGERKVSLTEREKECLFWACEGKTAWEMSKIIDVSERTVIFHLTSATKKLGASNRQHAVAKAIMYGLVKPVP